MQGHFVHTDPLELQGFAPKANISPVPMYLSGYQDERLFEHLQGLGDATTDSLPTDIQSIATSVSQAIQATTNPNMVPFTGNLVPTPTSSTVAAAGISGTALLLLGVGAFFLLRKR